MSKINPFKLLLDLFLLLFSYALVYLVKYGSLRVQEKYLVFLPILVFCWLVTGVFSSKFHDSDRARLEPLAYSALYLIGLVSLLIYGLQILALSRFVVFAGIVVYMLVEVIFVSGLILPIFVKREPERRRFSAFLLVGQAAVLSVAFFFLHYFKMNAVIVLNEEYLYVLFLIYFLWFFSALFSHGFVIDFSVNFFKMIVPFMKSYFMILSVFSVVVFGFRLGGFSRLLFFGTVLIYAAIEVAVLATLYMARYVHKSDIPEVNVFEAPLLHEDLVVQGVVSRGKNSGRYAIPGKHSNSILFSKKLASVYLKNTAAAFAFIERTVDLKKIDILKSEVMDSRNAYNVEILPDHSQEFLLNRHQLNDFRYLNQYLIQVNRKLENGGVFVGRFEPMERRYIYFRNRYPAFFARVFYVLDFFWKRMCPKMPLLKKVYFLITKGSGRVFSMAQGLGRLYYCGFEVIALEEEKNLVWFVANKVKSPLETVPSYALFFKQKRVGKGGEPIYIYKIRTMHPFSEFIHQYVFERNQLDDKGKIKDDFRITAWGRVFRKLWIDELPMVVNWIKRDLKLVGVRPLSETFFNTYPQDLQELRVQTKPGLVPPYYADMPRSIEDVWESERRYLERYAKKPLRTDWVYFWKAIYNIGFKKARSA